MATTTQSTPVRTTQAAPPVRKSRKDSNWGNPIVYFAALVLIALMIGPVLYIIWGQYVSSTAGTSTMATYMVTEGRNAGNYGYGNAVAVVLFVISLIIALVYQRLVLRRDTEGALTGGQ